MYVDGSESIHELCTCICLSEIETCLRGVEGEKRGVCTNDRNDKLQTCTAGELNQRNIWRLVAICHSRKDAQGARSLQMVQKEHASTTSTLSFSKS